MSEAAPAVQPDGSSAAKRVQLARRRLMEDELIGAARTLFTARGFDNVTVEEIAALAGVSSRTFYRYFAVKEELVVAVTGRLVASWAEAMVVRLADHSPVEALYETLALPDDAVHEDFVAWARIAVDAPSLRVYHHGATLARAREVLTNVLAEHAGLDPDDDMRPAVIAAAVIGAMDVATQRWLTHEGDRRALLKEALDILGSGLTVPLTGPPRPSARTAKRRR